MGWWGKLQRRQNPWPIGSACEKTSIMPVDLAWLGSSTSASSFNKGVSSPEVQRQKPRGRSPGQKASGEFHHP